MSTPSPVFVRLGRRWKGGGFISWRSLPLTSLCNTGSLPGSLHLSSPCQFHLLRLFLRTQVARSPLPTPKPLWALLLWVLLWVQRAFPRFQEHLPPSWGPCPSRLRFLAPRGQRRLQFFPLTAEGNTHKPRQKSVEAEGLGGLVRGGKEACSSGSDLGEELEGHSRVTM